MPPTFTWSSSEEGTSSGATVGRGRGETETEEEDVQDEGDKEEEGNKEIDWDTTESDSPPQ